MIHRLRQPIVVLSLTGALVVIGITALALILNRGTNGKTSSPEEVLARPMIEVPETVAAKELVTRMPMESDTLTLEQNAASVPEPEAPAVEEEDWRRLYSLLTHEEQRKELKTLVDKVNGLTKSEFERRFREGPYFIVGYGSSDHESWWDESEVMRVQIIGEGQPIKKVVLPRSQFPEVYAIHERIRWLRKSTGGW